MNLAFAFRRCILTLAMFVPLMLAGCATFREAEVGISRQFFSPDVEAGLGEEFHGQISQEFTLIDDPVANEWITRVGRELVQHSPPTEQEFRFHITDSLDVNAFAIPGGHCYVNLGLILYADTESQVIAVIGHEINHVTRRHGLLRLQRMMGVQLAASVAGAATGNEAVALAAAVAAQGGGYLAIQRFSRDDEREADILGVRAMHAAGYDPREAVRFFEKLVELQGARQPSYLEDWLATHPASRARVEYLQAEIATLPRRDGLIVNRPEFTALQQRLREMYVPKKEEAPAQ